MHRYLEEIEKIADKLIIPALLAVLVIVILELFFTELAHDYHGLINLTDTIVILIFVVDLTFKLHRAKDWEGFLKNHWLEIIAIMPLFYVFRLIEIVRLAATVELGQETAHLAEGARSGRFTEVFRSSSVSRSTRFSRFVRAFSRTPRFAKAVEFFKHPEEHVSEE